MAATERRITDLEGKLETVVPARLTPREQLTAERYVALLVQGKPIPKLLKKQFQKLPPEPPPHPAIEALIEDVMGGNGSGKNGNSLRSK